MNCIYCNYDNTDVVETRVSNEGLTVRRRRQCQKCQRRFTTYERAKNHDLQVIKKSGEVEKFDKAKIEESLRKACKGQDITEFTILQLTEDICKEILSLNKTRVETKDIANAVLRKLHDLDEVAFVRFASYQYKTESIEDFGDLMKKALEDIS